MAYSNRTDLNEKPRQPVIAPTAQQYGDRVRNEEAQRIAPLPRVPEVRPPEGGAAAALGYTGPPLPPITAPTMRPDEPITAGLSTGMGPGPEAIGLGAGGQDHLARLAGYLPTLEILASSPSSTQEIRNFVRLVRANAQTGA